MQRSHSGRLCRSADMQAGQAALTGTVDAGEPTLIILDANVLPRHGSLAGPAFALVRAIAEKTGHDVALPAIVVEESVAKFTRELRKAWDRTKTAEQALAEFFPGYRIDQPDLDKRVEQW